MDEKEGLIKAYFSELGKKSAEAKIKRYGAEGFHNYLKQIAKLPRKRLTKSERFVRMNKRSENKVKLK